MCTIIGRKQEIAEFNRRLNSNRAEFIAVYGRRRVGKTFLINEVFRDNMVFRHTGLSPYDKKKRQNLKAQLQNFYFSLINHGMEDINPPKTWLEAFFLLEQFLTRIDNGSRQVIFIDELPWMDTPRSGFLSALEAFWNGWANARHNLCLIVCGSASSWIIDNLINNKGGLYGRLTLSMKLYPFTLGECEEFFVSRGIKMSRYNIVQAYMILGGIPYYLDYFNPSMSLAQNIDALFFNTRAKLNGEFERLFNSIFDNAGKCMEIVRTLGKRHAGFSRGEIAEMTSTEPNGEFTKILKALEESGFITPYIPYGGSKREVQYKLSDCFSWFWLHFKENRIIKNQDYWQNHLNESEISSWRGIAFEEVCLLHIRQIKSALQILGVSSQESSLIIKDNEKKGMQIDLLIDRADDVVNVCEIKFCKSAFSVSSDYAQKLTGRISALEETNRSKTFHLTYIGVNPLAKNEYSDVFQSSVTAEELFRQ
ncbi:MAG: ATP-binding protein [Bacteroidales bacterium]|nr:ATP-binding protein [Bacteroidales bacterium]